MSVIFARWGGSFKSRERLIINSFTINIGILAPSLITMLGHTNACYVIYVTCVMCVTRGLGRWRNEGEIPLEFIQ